MLKECYYKNQTNFNKNDYQNLYRFIDRMIQYRYYKKGSYNGKNRIEEIKNIRLDLLSYNTKIILKYCIEKHKAYELYHLENLYELNNIEYKNIDFLKGDYMKLKASDFFNNLKELNDKINELIQNKELPEDYIFNIKCIGGFAMSYLGIRSQGLTEDMDNLTEINYIVKRTIKTIAEKNSLPYDWVNDTMLHFYSEDQFHWQEVKWFFGRNAKIKVFVCSKEDLLKMKIKMAECYLNNQNFQDRDPEIDYYDTLDLLDNLNIGHGTNITLIEIKLANIGININNYPKMYEKIKENSLEEDLEDKYILNEINKVDKYNITFDYFKHDINKHFGYTLEDINDYYNFCFDYFPNFKKYFYKEFDTI